MNRRYNQIEIKDSRIKDRGKIELIVDMAIIIKLKPRVELVGDWVQITNNLLSEFGILAKFYKSI